MAAIPGEVRDLLESGALAHLTTINRDGSPQVTCVWVGLEGDEIVVGTLARRQKVRNVERDPRVALSVPSQQRNRFGLQEYRSSTAAPASRKAVRPSCSGGWRSCTWEPGPRSRSPARHPATCSASPPSGSRAWGRGRPGADAGRARPSESAGASEASSDGDLTG
jgi:hypothetical protein